MDHNRQIKAVLFDLDNTLLDRTTTFRNFSETFVNRFINDADDKPYWVDKIIQLDEDGYKSKPALFAELIELMPWREKPPLADLLNFYEIGYVENAVLMEKAREVIQYTRSKFKTGIITNGQTKIQYGKIDRLGIRDQFDLILVSEEAGVKKPDPAIFEMALNRLGMEPEQCLFVGDHPVNDIEGAAKAGMHTVWLQVNQGWKDGLTAVPLRNIQQLSELQKLL